MCREDSMTARRDINEIGIIYINKFEQLFEIWKSWNVKVEKSFAESLENSNIIMFLIFDPNYGLWQPFISSSTQLDFQLTKSRHFEHWWKIFTDRHLYETCWCTQIVFFFSKHEVWAWNLMKFYAQIHLFLWPSNVGGPTVWDSKIIQQPAWD